MTDAELDDVNGFMMKKIIMAGGRIDRIYCCTQLKSTLGNYRKPNPEMAYMAVRDFNVNLSKSIMIGDTDSDIEFGKMPVCTLYSLEMRQSKQNQMLFSILLQTFP